MQTKIGPILIGLAYLALVVFIMLFCAKQSSGFADFSKYWGLFATLVGVATGAIPSFFFKAQAEAAQVKADEQSARASREATKAQLYAEAADPSAARQIRTDNAELFR